jgi:WD40 repeat protein
MPDISLPPTGPDEPTLPSPDSLLDRLLAERRRRWQSGERDLIRDLLDRHPELAADARRAAVLVYAEFVHREEAGESPALDDYLRSFPALAEELRRLHEAEALLAGLLPPWENLPNGPTRLGDYLLLNEVGRGGMGVVYRARQVSLGRLVALKMMRSGILAGPEEVARFQAEAQTAARLRHPTIVAVHEVGEHEGRHYFSMDYVEGGSLADSTRGGRPLPAQQAARCAEAIARAVQYAHTQKVLHRDLKPSNVLLDAAGEPHVTDFGLAKALGGGPQLTATGQALGTPGYMAPEQADGRSKDVGPAVDVYGLGAILYELLTGRPPFQADTPLVTLQQVVTADPAAPRQLNRDVPRDLETVCLKCLRKEPHRRYATAQELADDLRRFLDGRPVLARRVGPAGRLGRWARRNPVVAALGAAVLILLISVSVILYFRAEERRTEALLQEARLERTPPRQHDWSERAWRAVVGAVRGRRDIVMRTEAGAVCDGLDARADYLAEGMAGSSLVFEPSGQRLLIGGTDADKPEPAQEARLIDMERREVIGSSGRAGAGPVTFAGGTPLQVVPGSDGLTIWDVGRHQEVRSLRAPAPVVRGPALDLPVVAITPGAARVAAAVESGLVVVWDGSTGEERLRVSAAATALALSSDGTLLACGDAKGVVTVWSLPDGKPVVEHRCSAAVTSLTFRPDLLQLAAGDDVGALWLCDTKTPHSIFIPGTSQGVFALAYSSDGTLLVSGGRHSGKVWDSATGRQLLLGFHAPDGTTALAFSPDAERVAATSVRSFNPGYTVVSRLENGRGMRTLLGLRSQVARVCFAPDGSRLAAYARPGEVGVWDVETGRLLARLVGPDALSTENADFCFSPDGRQLACCGKDGAILWDLQKQKPPEKWDLPKGLAVRIRMRADGRLVVLRAEREKAGGPWRVFLRELLPGGATFVLRQVDEFGDRVFDAAAMPDGSLFFAVGRAAGAEEHVVRAYDGNTGAVRWQDTTGLRGSYDDVQLDPEGRFLKAGSPGTAVLRNPATGNVVATYAVGCVLGPSARFSLRANAGVTSLQNHAGFALCVPAGGDPVIGLAIDAHTAGSPECSRDGRYIAWGNANGSVTICDLRRIEARLREIGLGWRGRRASSG